jgi:hypothetical protein
LPNVNTPYIMLKLKNEELSICTHFVLISQKL